jgi:hypothetical protein
LNNLLNQKEASLIIKAEQDELVRDFMGFCWIKAMALFADAYNGRLDEQERQFEGTSDLDFLFVVLLARRIARTEGVKIQLDFPDWIE